uniref:Uncharacterized protein n=1 Tax=Sus scrofa TaxID=9823 RepID=A0A8D1I8G9_PIG
MFGITNYQRNANQNYNEVGTISHLSEWPSLKNLQIINVGEGVEKKGNFLHCWWECKLVQPLWRTIWRILKKPKIELPYDPAIPFLGIYLEKTLTRKDTGTLMFTKTLFITAKTWKQPKCPLIDEWIKKKWCIYIYTHIHNGYYLP